MADEQIDQDSLAAEWGVALEAEQKAGVKDSRRRHDRSR